MKDALTELTRQARVLGDQVDGFAVALEHLDRRTSRSDRRSIVLSFVLALVVVVCAALAWVVAQQTAQGARLEQQGARLEQIILRESATRQQSICPVYAVFLGSYNPSSRAEGPARDSYIEAFKIMQAAYDRLDCADPIVPPRFDTPPATIPTR